MLNNCLLHVFCVSEGHQSGRQTGKWRKKNYYVERQQMVIPFYFASRTYDFHRKCTAFNSNRNKYINRRNVFFFESPTYALRRPDAIELAPKTAEREHVCGV